MSDISLFEAMRTCRTVRRLRPDPVPDALLHQVLTAATWAPSGGNRQAWRFLVVRDAETKQALADLYRPLWHTFSQAYVSQLDGLPPERRATHDRMLSAATHLADHFHEAPVLLVVCVHMPELAITDLGLDRPPIVGGASIYPAIQNLQLACRGVGLGAALTTLLCREEPAVRALLGIPDGWATAAHLAVGFPSGKGHGPLQRKPVERVAYLDRWDVPLFK
ncbi:MAG TPA: nitroreductase family protein [Candidatus Binatia bacterium]|jgi:nitroreductase|nr:nitroreductase family protein [Candidatus Binatia bacterium]